MLPQSHAGAAAPRGADACCRAVPRRLPRHPAPDRAAAVRRPGARGRDRQPPRALPARADGVLAPGGRDRRRRGEPDRDPGDHGPARRRGRLSRHGGVRLTRPAPAPDTGPMRRLSRALLALLALMACTAAAPAHAQSPATVARAVPPVTKLLVFVEENHSLDQMRAGMPYVASLAEQYGHATDYHATRHPSLPNYLAIARGSTYGVADDALPPAHRLAGRSVFGQALRNHRTAATCAESMPVRCGRSNPGAYAPKHNPWTYFARERTACATHDRGMRAFA